MTIYHRGAPLNYPVPHDPDATAWYAMIFDDALGGATITDGEFSITAPEDDETLTIEGEEIGVTGTYGDQSYQQICRVLLAGGTDGVRYTITCQVTTSSGEILEKSFILRVAEN